MKEIHSPFVDLCPNQNTILSLYYINYNAINLCALYTERITKKKMKIKTKKKKKINRVVDLYIVHDYSDTGKNVCIHDFFLLFDSKV